MWLQSGPIAQSPVARMLRAFSTSFARLSRRLKAGRDVRRLRLCETLSLANRGYLAVVRYGEQQFLVGGTSNSIALLAQLSNGASSAATLVPAGPAEMTGDQSR